MGEASNIAWTDDTFNPWWGCVRVSPGCENCYAESLATVRRKLQVWGVDAPRKAMSEAHWRLPLKWNREAEAAGVRRRVFCASMADAFERAPARNLLANDVMDRGRARLWPLIEQTPWLDWQLLTKRPENIAQIAPWKWRASVADRPEWPRNVWIGTTVEDAKRAAERLPYLAEIPAAVRYVSYEPALELVDFRPWLASIDWIIVGGESGPGARPFRAEWAENVLRQCEGTGVAVFIKQMGANAHRMPPACRGWVPMALKDKKGGDPAEWPESLRVQEFPEVRT